MPDIANAGLFGTPGTLPSGAGAVEPPLLPSAGTGYWSNPDWSFLNQTPGQTGYGDMFAQLSDVGSGRFGNGPEAGFDSYDRLFRGGSDPNYPAPGTGARTANQNFLARLLNHTPQGMLRNAIRDAITANQTRANMQGNPGSWQGPPAMPAGGALFGYNPASGGAGGTPHYDPGTGRTTSTPSTNPLYSTGGAWQPVANAPTDIRFAQNSGTGNWQADQTTKAFLLGGGYSGSANNMRGVSDAGRTRFVPQSGFVGQINPDTGILERVAAPYDASKAFVGTQGGGAPSSSNTEAYNAWLMQQPEYAQWQAANPGAGQRNPFSFLINPDLSSVSGPPRLPGT